MPEDFSFSTTELATAASQTVFECQVFALFSGRKVDRVNDRNPFSRFAIVAEVLETEGVVTKYCPRPPETSLATRVLSPVPKSNR